LIPRLVSTSPSPEGASHVLSNRSFPRDPRRPQYYRHGDCAGGRHRRIWSGQEAKNLGLFDELGGYETALKLATQGASIPEKDDVKIVIYPRHKSFFGSVFAHRSPDNSDKEVVGQTLARILEVVQPVARQLDAAGIKGNQVQAEVLGMVQFDEGK
jgi:hypothetical protein